MLLELFEEDVLGVELPAHRTYLDEHLISQLLVPNLLSSHLLAHVRCSLLLDQVDQDVLVLGNLEVAVVNCFVLQRHLSVGLQVLVHHLRLLHTRTHFGS
jgi:hypothetical protein